MTMPVHFHIRQRDREEVPGEEAEDAHRDDPPAPEPEVQRSSTPISDRSPPSPPHTTSAAVHTDTPGPSYSAHQSPEYTHVSSREMAGVMDAICCCPDQNAYTNGWHYHQRTIILIPSNSSNNLLS